MRIKIVFADLNDRIAKPWAIAMNGGMLLLSMRGAGKKKSNECNKK